MTEFVDVDLAQISSGAAQWSARAEALRSAWGAAADAVEGLAAAKPWGADAAGAQFRSTYHPEEAVGDGRVVMAGVLALGPNVARAAAISADADAEQAQQMGLVLEQNATDPGSYTVAVRPVT